MSKINCELCGTAFSDTEERCPTCGSEKPEIAEFAAPQHEDSMRRREYTPTKGGRFSEANVKKRLQHKGVAPASVATPQRSKSSQLSQQPRQSKPAQKPRQEQSNKGLVITAVILVIAIIAMIGYIYVTFFMPKAGPEQPNNDAANQQHQQIPGATLTPPDTDPEEPDLSCKSLILSEKSIRLDQEGASWLLNVIPEPANTVDVITYVSADTNVATVSSDGTVTAVGTGETVITITCGRISVDCAVVCDLAPATTAPEETTPPETTVPKVDFKLNREDITFDAKGQTWQLYKGEIPLSDIVWTSGNTNVCTVKDGVVKAVGKGRTVVTAEYNGVKVECIIRCSF